MLVLPNVYWVRKNVRGANIYVIEEDKGITIIDCGSEGSDEGIVDFVYSLGSTPEDIKTIIITHGHPDHVGALPELIDLTDAEIYVHEKELALVERFTMLKISELSNVKLLQGDELIDVLGGTKVLHSPGHTDGSIVLYNADKKILITGDVLLTNKNGELILPRPEYTKDMKKEIESLKKLVDLDFEAILPGHGPVITENGRNKLLSFVKKL